MSNITGDDGSFSSGNTGEEVQQKQQQQQPQNHLHGSGLGPNSSTVTNSNGSSSSQQQQQQQQPIKKKRNLPGTPDPNAEVIALSPTTLMATNRFVCEICNKGFQRDQNLQLHRRGHNLPWKLRQRTSNEIRKRVYICPEPSCVHHNPARALGDLTGIKKHYSRKHGEKKWKCDKCSKKYAVQSDWKAHSKTCGTREYKCDCGTIFSRRDSFITHRAFCDALAEENNKVNQGLMANMGSNLQSQMPELMSSMPLNSNSSPSVGMSEFNSYDPKNPLKSLPQDLVPMPFKSPNMSGGMFSSSSGTLFGGPRSISSSSSGLQLSSNSSSGFNYLQDGKNGTQLSGSANMSATALLQKAAQMGATASNSINSPMMQKSFVSSMAAPELSPIRPSPYVTIQQQTNSYDHHFQSQPDQSPLVGINGGGLPSQFLQKGPQEITPLFETVSGSASMNNDIGMFGNVFIGGDQNSPFLKNMENEDSSSTSSLAQGRTVMARSATGPSRFGGNGGGNDVTTLDLLGVGGSRPVNLQEQQQRLELEAMSQHRMQAMTTFQQQLSHGEPAIEQGLYGIYE